jgi:glutamate formiminotransferase
LIAFNVYLAGNGEAAVRDIARTIRESSGGLPAVRAIGFEAAGRGYVTVSMSLVDFEVTGIREAFDAVATEAAARGLEIVDSEIVGLVPAPAASPEVLEHARVAGFDPERQVLDRLIEDRPPAAPWVGERVEEQAEEEAEEEEGAP